MCDLKISANRRGFANDKCDLIQRILHLRNGFCDFWLRLVAFYFCDLNPAILICVCCCTLIQDVRARASQSSMQANDTPREPMGKSMKDQAAVIRQASENQVHIAAIMFSDSANLSRKEDSRILRINLGIQNGT